MTQNLLRHALRKIGQKVPALKTLGGRMGIGRLVSQGTDVIEHIIIDDDVVIELDLSISQFRHIYFLENPANAAESILARRLLSKTDTYVDIGANLGYFTLIAAKYAGKVIAFEPSPKTFSYLQRNINLNPVLANHLVAYQLGLSNRSGDAVIHFSDDAPGFSSLQPVHVTKTREVPIRLETLDNMMIDESPFLLKVDVEGAELDVFLGGIKTIERCRPIIFCELCETWQKRFAHSTLEICSFFHARGYSGWLIDEKRPSMDIKLSDLTESRLISNSTNNGFFVPNERIKTTISSLTNN